MIENIPIQKVLIKYYLDNQWNCGNTYDTLEWNDTTMPKPTEEELKLRYDELLVDEMRTQRDNLLKESDMYALPDFPHKTEEKKQEWLSYRQQLRDFTQVWILGMSFPNPPTK